MKNKRNKLAVIVTLIHFIITFFTDRLIFTASFPVNPAEYFGCKVVLLILLFLIWRAILNPSDAVKEILKYAAIYLIPIIAVLIFKLPQGFLSNDERLIFEEASALSNYTWFYYLTTWYFIISMMIIPSWLGPILIKVVLQLLICGYCIYRLSRYMNFKYAKFLYLAFLLPPVLAYTTSAHRIPVYFLIYLFLLFSLAMDKLQGCTVSRWKLLWVLILGALITQWRTEGIYFVVELPILLFICYPELRTKKAAIKLILCSLLIQYIVSVPQNGLIPGRMQDKANNRMGPFYAYTITNMYRNGLDLEKNKEALEKIDRYLDLSTLEAINNDLKDINYEDVLILYYPGYTGLREGYTDEDYRAYVEGCQDIFIHNPDVFFKTRTGAFNYAALPYSISYDQPGAKGFLLFLVSIVKTIAYNLYIPHFVLLCIFIYALIRRRFFTFFVAGGLICHWFIVFVLAPASYFKYYFPIYMTAYFIIILQCIAAVWRRFHPEKPLSLLP